MPKIRLVEVPDTGERVPIYTTGAAWPYGTSGFPRSVRVGRQTYKVLLHTELFGDARGKQSLYGAVSVDHRVILIDPDQPVAHALHTLAHERAHAYLASQRDPRLAKMTDAQVEGVCDLIADVLEDVGALR